MRRLRGGWPAAAAVVAMAMACSRQPPAPADAAGLWRGILGSPGGDLPFGLEIEEAAGGLSASLVNGGERTPPFPVEVRGDRWVARLGPRSEMTWSMDGEGRILGIWEIRRGLLPERMIVAARREAGRFGPLPPGRRGDPGVDPAGEWDLLLVDERGSRPGTARLRREGKALIGSLEAGEEAAGVMEGDVRDGVMRLSRFDGQRAVLVVGLVHPDRTMTGDLWTGATGHASWSARPAP
ncbi:MAG TPA: hypothetical protein VJV23_16050 [Candidatus Polarisedimenticolia bacterium]|nr:hypothetical protein [Candidatus Polarisedimenticolia bacterium]